MKRDLLPEGGTGPKVEEFEPLVDDPDDGPDIDAGTTVVNLEGTDEPPATEKPATDGTTPAAGTPAATTDPKPTTPAPGTTPGAGTTPAAGTAGTATTSTVKLPVGATLDLSKPTFTLDNQTWSIPSALSVAAGKDYSAADWVIVAKKTRLMYGLNMDRAVLADEADNAGAERPALLWKITDSDDYVDLSSDSLVTSTMSYTADVSSLVKNRIVAGSLNVTTPFVSATASVSRNEKQAENSTRKRLFMTGLWRYRQAKVTLTGCTVLAPDFVSAIDTALGLPAPERFDALRAVFGTFGHVVPSSVVLGGQLFFQSDRTTTGQLDSRQVTNTVEAAVSAKYKGVSAGADASFKDGEAKEVTAQSIAESVAFTCVGGDTTLGSAPDKWASTVKDPNKWAVILRERLVPLVDRLDPDRKSRVTAVWQAGLREHWGGRMPPEGYITQDLEGQPFSISTSGTTQTPIGPVAENGGFAQLLPSSLLSDPARHGLLWQLRYSGKTARVAGVSRPIYWIVEVQTPEARRAREDLLEVVQAKNAATQAAIGVAGTTPEPVIQAVLGVRKAGETSYAACLSADDLTTNAGTPELSAATWTVRLADPSGYREQDAANTYVIQHVVSGLVLGAVRDKSTITASRVPDKYVALKEASETSPGWVLRTAPVN